ncbi:MAG: hypothetical protein K9K38_17750 [Rhodoferax sp.]|nr:hypothetical protein [Rhodoferax sp.]MCF8211223.1 hypothetical protein [Rhodoferax sp.]
MKIETDGFAFQFTGALDAFRFDEKDRAKPHFHGLSHAMKAVDLVVEMPTDYLFIEVKDFHAADDYDFKSAVAGHQRDERLAHFNHLREVLKHKFRDTWLYRWAQGKADKPVRYLCLLSVLSKELRQQLPVGLAGPHWEKALARSCVVLNLERWNVNFPQWPVVPMAV